jgi:hypothetical protein
MILFHASRFTFQWFWRNVVSKTEQYKATLPTRAIAGQPAAKEYQQRITGDSLEYKITANDGVGAWFDGIELPDGIETKFISDWPHSPYNPQGATRNGVRFPFYNQVQLDLADQLIRQAHIVRTGSTPLTGMRLVTNHPDAAVPLIKGGQGGFSPFGKGGNQRISNLLPR